MSLQNAVKSHDLAQVKALLEQGVDINQRFEDGCTALMIAATIGDKAIVRALVKAGAEVNLKNTQGDTALTLAARAGHIPICEYLSILTEPSERQRAAQILAPHPCPSPLPLSPRTGKCLSCRGGKRRYRSRLFLTQGKC